MSRADWRQVIGAALVMLSLGLAVSVLGAIL